MGRWSWSSDAWDFDHDGYPDLYIANGMITGPESRDLSSFFWRQVVAQSPQDAQPSHHYEQAWNALNELVRSDGSLNARERNTFYINHRDGTFSDVSGAVGLDFLEDGRAFALADFDHDGRLEVVLKNRNGPQLRILANRMTGLGESIAFRLRGRTSNRDAIGAAVIVETGRQRQVKFVQAGSGFLSQHTKELFFGLGDATTPVQATIRWPGGLVQHFRDLPVGHRIEIEEGLEKSHVNPFVAGVRAPNPSKPRGATELPFACGTWLVAPLAAPDFSLPDLQGRTYTVTSFRGHPLLLNFWATWSPPSLEDLLLFERHQRRWSAQALRLAAVNIDDHDQARKVGEVVEKHGLSVLVLLASGDAAGIYNLLFRYLFDRRRDLGIPTSFLLDPEGFIVKVYQGQVQPERLEKDLRAIPRTSQERLTGAVPFPGTYYGGQLERSLYTYGAAFFQSGYFDQAISSFQQVLAQDPANAGAYSNLGALYMKKKMPTEARRHLLKAVQLRPDLVNALNNLGVLAAHEGRMEEAVSYWKEAVRVNASDPVALGNLGNLYREQGRWADAREILERALDADPQDPELNYSLGMLFAQIRDSSRARQYLQKAIALRPNYPEALNNLGVLYLLTGRMEEAAATLKDCVRVAPEFDEPYLNLAKVYVALGEREKAEEVLRQLL